jgi:hypothetical protein
MGNQAAVGRLDEPNWQQGNQGIITNVQWATATCQAARM